MKRAITFGLFCLLLSAGAVAQQDDRRAAGYRLTAELFELVCPSVSMNTASERKRVEGNADMALSNLVKKLVGLDFGAAAQYESEQARGPLREHLAALQKDLYGCRLGLFRMVSKDLMGEHPVELAPNKTVPAGPLPAVKAPPKASTAAPARTPVPVKSGPILRVFYKNNLTPQHLDLLARTLPQFDVRPGMSVVDPLYSADTLFVNRNKVREDEVMLTVNALREIGVAIKSVQQQALGGRKEIQVGTITSSVMGITQFSSAQTLDPALLGTLRGADFWRYAYNGKVFCAGPDHTFHDCSVNADARPVETEN